MVYLWGCLASFCAVWQEILCRSTNKTWLELLPYNILPMFGISYFIFKLLRLSDNLLSAFVVFAMCNLFLRVTASRFILHEQIKPGTWVAMGLLLLAQAAKRLG